MRRALRPNRGRQRVSIGKSVTFPVGGWNAVDPLASMKPEYAVALENIFPDQGYGKLRGGNREYSDTGELTPIESVMAYHGSAGNKMFGATGEYIFDMTVEGDPATEDLDNLSNARWQHVNFATSGGEFLWACNGADDPIVFNGSTWASAVITTITAEDIIGVTVYKNRLWFAFIDSIDSGYLDADSIQGAGAYFPLTGVFSKGGHLMAVGTWTIDGGAGPDDRLVLVSSRGQVAVYSGSNPDGVDADMALNGVYNLAPPIGRRCLLNVGGDIAIVTIAGVVPLSKAMVTDQAATDVIALTKKIQPVMVQSARDWKDNFGWQLTAYPRATMGILNVPITESGQQVQYVMNTVTGAWCKFTGWNANCFEVFEDRLFFGGNDGKLYEADRSGADGTSAISIDIQCAFNYFGEKGRQKHFKLVRPILTTDGTVSPSLGVNVDFRDDAQLSTPSSAILPQARWDEALWDEALWPVERRTQTSWQGVSGYGYCASIRMRSQIASLGEDDAEQPIPTFNINAFDIIYEGGGLVG